MLRRAVACSAGGPRVARHTRSAYPLQCATVTVTSPPLQCPVRSPRGGRGPSSASLHTTTRANSLGVGTRFPTRRPSLCPSWGQYVGLCPTSATTTTTTVAALPFTGSSRCFSFGSKPPPKFFDADADLTDEQGAPKSAASAPSRKKSKKKASRSQATVTEKLEMERYSQSCHASMHAPQRTFTACCMLLPFSTLSNPPPNTPCPSTLLPRSRQFFQSHALCSDA